MKNSYLPALRKEIVNLRKPAPPEWEAAFKRISKRDCVDYIFNLTVNRTYDGFIREKSVIEDNLAKQFPKINFQASDPELDHAGDIDYLGWVGDRAFGIQIKPVTTKANFGNYSATARMQRSFEDFTAKYGGKVFIIFSVDDKIYNAEVIEQIKAEINRLSQ